MGERCYSILWIIGAHRLVLVVDVKEIDKLLYWFRQKENLANLRTATTVVFIIVFVVYFYGFRTGFQLTINDIGEILIDMTIVIVSSYAVINDFSMRGVQAELGEENEELIQLTKKHHELTSDLDEDGVHNALIDYNKQEEKKAMEKKKREYAKKYKRKRRKKPPNSKKYKKLTEKIVHYEDPETFVKVNRRETTVDDLIKRGANKNTKKEIGVSYSPHKDTLASQSGMVTVMVLFTSLMRVALDPSWSAFGEALLFLSWLLPFLLIRAVLSYQISRRNTKDNYPLAIQRQINIINWCLSHKKGD